VHPRTVAVHGARSPRRATTEAQRVAPRALGYSCSKPPDGKENDMSDGSVDEGKGRLKEAAGELTGDESLKNEGKVDKASGKVKDAVGGAADKAKDALRND
jgi:uncharacterized protein YjbJ (UPF0337 family)